MSSPLRVDDEQRRLGARRAGDHVFQKFDVSRGVDDEIIPLRRLEEAARRVDGDALTALVLERVEKEGVLERLRVAAAHLAYLLKLALRQRIGIGKQPPDNGGFSVVNVTDNYYVHGLS